MSETTHTHPADSVKRLERSRSDRMLAGVCGGLARYFDIHPAVYRVGFVVLTILGGAGLVIYLAAAMVMPNEGQEDSFATRILRERRNRPWPVIGLGFVAIGLASWLSKATLWPHGDAWFILLVLGGALLWITRHGRGTPGDPTTLAKEDTRRVRRLFKGVAIAAGTLLALLLVATAVFASVFHVHLGNGVGTRTYVIDASQDIKHTYKLGIGSLNIDLRTAELPPGETSLSARVDVGHLEIHVPTTAAVRVDATARAGQLDLIHSNEGGQHLNITETSPPLTLGGVKRPITDSTPIVVIHAHVGAGQITVVRGHTTERTSD